MSSMDSMCNALPTNANGLERLLKISVVFAKQRSETALLIIQEITGLPRKNLHGIILKGQG